MRKINPGAYFMRHTMSQDVMMAYLVNTLRPRQNGRYFPHDIFKCISLNENVLISITLSLTLVPKFPIDNKQALVQIMAWRLQAIIWTNDGQVYRGIYASLGLHELRCMLYTVRHWPHNLSMSTIFVRESNPVCWVDLWMDPQLSVHESTHIASHLGDATAVAKIRNVQRIHYFINVKSSVLADQYHLPKVL